MSLPDLTPADVEEAEHESWFYVRCTEAQAMDLASGYVPNAVRCMVRTMVDWQEQDQRRAARPVRVPKKRSGSARSSDAVARGVPSQHEPTPRD